MAKETTKTVVAEETVKAQATKVEAAKVETAKTEKVEKKAPAKKAAAKKTATKKAETEKAEKKAPAKKATTAKKTATKKAAKVEMFLQYNDNQLDESALMDRVKADCEAQGVDAKELKLYLKPQDNACYYVANGNVAGKVDLF